MKIQPYGTMIAVGVLIAGVAGWWISKRLRVDFNDIILLFTYGVSFGFIGAKGMYFLVNIHRIPWSDVNVLQMVADGGFVFYGGLPAGAVGLLLAQRIHKLEIKRSLRICVPLLPLGHAFGRMGCFLVGCCYGVTYNGPLAITYHSSLIAPNEALLFPVQILEAVLLIFLSAVLLVALSKGAGWSDLGIFYLEGYGIIRFFLEFLRGDLERGVAAGLSTSQWISMAVLVSCGLLKLYRCKERII